MSAYLRSLVFKIGEWEGKLSKAELELIGTAGTRTDQRSIDRAVEYAKQRSKQGGGDFYTLFTVFTNSRCHRDRLQDQPQPLNLAELRVLKLGSGMDAVVVVYDNQMAVLRWELGPGVLLLCSRSSLPSPNITRQLIPSYGYYIPDDAPSDDEETRMESYPPEYQEIPSDSSPLQFPLDL